MTDVEAGTASAGTLQTHLREIRFPLTPAIEREIQREVCDYTDELKALGLPPVRVILALKRVANDAGVQSTFRSIALRSSLDPRDKLLADMVAWCIQRFYEPRPHAD